jgi:hypothetical protein
MTGGTPCLGRAPRRVALIAGVLVGSLLFSAGAEGGQTGNDFDCTDFDSREDAQAFYEETGGPIYDPFNLDDDDDGVACEEWMRGYEQVSAGEDGINGEDGIDHDCADFANTGEAQQYFVLDGGSAQINVDHLDPNHNGIACESGEPG